MLLGTERRDVAEGGDRLAAAGLVVGTAGNLSAGSGDLVAVTPTGLPIAGLRVADVAVVDRAGRRVDGVLAPTSEVPLHLAVYEATGAGAIAHTHAPASTAVACALPVGADLPAWHYACVPLGGPPRVAAYATFGTQALAEAVAEALHGGRTTALMSNHGSIAVGATVAEACERLATLEWLCEVHVRVVAMGGGRDLTEDDLAEAEAAFRSSRYGQSRPAPPADPPVRQ